MLGFLGEPASPGPRLTERELEVAGLVAEGLTNQAIATAPVDRAADRRSARGEHPAQAGGALAGPDRGVGDRAPASPERLGSSPDARAWPRPSRRRNTAAGPVVHPIAAPARPVLASKYVTPTSRPAIRRPSAPPGGPPARPVILGYAVAGDLFLLAVALARGRRRQLTPIRLRHVVLSCLGAHDDLGHLLSAPPRRRYILSDHLDCNLARRRPSRHTQEPRDRHSGWACSRRSTCSTGLRRRPGRFWPRSSDAGIDHVCCGDHVSFFAGIGFDGLVQATALAMLHPTLPVYYRRLPAAAAPSGAGRPPAGRHRPARSRAAGLRRRRRRRGPPRGLDLRGGPGDPRRADERVPGHRARSS